MIAAWAGLVVAIVAVLVALPAATAISTVSWPGETPLSLHDNRARDPHLRHLARILASDSTAEAQHTIAEISEGLVNSSAVVLFEGDAAARARLGPEVARFIAEAPDQDHERFLRQLAQVLDRIESL